MDILQVSTCDIAGGAERVAWNLFNGYRLRGHRSRLAVGEKRGDDPDVFPLPNQPSTPWATFWGGLEQKLGSSQVRGAARLRALARTLRDPRRTLSRWRGHEDFYFAGTRLLLAHQPDILHCHNLHGGYFDLRLLPALSQRQPVVFTLHDAWLLSGHCAHSFGCDRWQNGCGNCPDLEIYPRLQRDGTAYNWGRKREIYAQSRLYISTPCQWLMDKVGASMLMGGAVETRVLPYGVDLEIFQPGDKNAARARLGLPQDVVLLLFSAASIRANPFKDYQTMQAALAYVADRYENEQKIIFIALGENAPPEKLSDKVEIWFLPYQKELPKIADFYRAADIYLHLARADTFPNAVLEALACGTPVIGSRVGGIPEQVTDAQSGRLVAAGDGAAAGAIVHQLIGDAGLRTAWGDFAAADARRRFDLRDQVQTHLDWYEEILWRSKSPS